MNLQKINNLDKLLIQYLIIRIKKMNYQIRELIMEYCHILILDKISKKIKLLIIMI